jgi:hypothetical protein
MKTNDSRLLSAMRRITRRPARPGPRSANTPRDWQQLIESELDALNRRLSSIEARMTVVFYLVVILTITTIVTNASAAEQLMRGVLQIK